MMSIPLLETTPVPVSFNQSRFREDLVKTDSRIEIFKSAIEAIDTQLNRRFIAGEGIRSLIYERALLVDCILYYAWSQFSWSDDISLIAVGGYGRGELHPQSDIDLLILLADEETRGNSQDKSQDNESTQGFLTLLWDIGLQVGHSVRTLKECCDIASEDITVATNIMESRLLQGSADLLQALNSATTPDKIWSNDTFFAAKFDEQVNRHEKYNDTEYNLEPNVKNAPGGLRDIQTIQWLAKRYYGVTTLDALHDRGFFTEAEYATLVYSEEFLWRVRYGLHMIAKRPEERLLFDYQKELAALFGYEDKDGKLAIEQFMHDYYRVVLSIRELNDVLLHFLDEVIINPGTSTKVTPINERFQLRNNYIEAIHANVFKENPSALLEIFVLTGNHKNISGIRASTIRLIREYRHLVDDSFRANPLNKMLFLSLLRVPNRLTTQLRRMKRYGILGRYLPEFDLIIGQMQHDLFHIYTVDDHTLNLIEFIRRLIILPNSEKQFPLVAKVTKSLPKIELLYIASLYHDIGKGRGGDHSILGSVDAKKFCEEHHLSKRETLLISWLVENHLAMSSTSQKNDISDPQVIYNFAELVGDELHLDYLYALTVADMNATNPNIWNNWRASLLQELYRQTRQALRRGLENPIDKEEVINERQEEAMEKLRQLNHLDEQAVWELWQTAGDDYFLRESSHDIVWHTEAILTQKNQQKPLVLVAEHTIRGNHKVTQIFIRALSKDNIFAAATNALDQLDLNIQDARIYSTVSGYTMDTFYVLDQNGLPVTNDANNYQHVIDTIINELALSDQYSDIIKRRTPRQLKHFNAPTRANISNDLSQDYTTLEVVSPDRPGFLALIARIFVENDIALVNAKITTLGERVEDVFFITDKNGERLSDPNQCKKLQTAIEEQLNAKVVDEEITL
jgi:[protein-PII] uridylyltransferase